MNIWKETININEKSDSGSIFELWPIDKDLNSKTIHPIFKCPTFHSYKFRQSPPTCVTDYFPISIPSIAKCTDVLLGKSLLHYSPALDPPNWPRIEENCKKPQQEHNKIVEKLTLSSSSKSNYPLYDFNGDFFLKFFVLECYGIILFLSLLPKLCFRRWNYRIFMYFDNMFYNYKRLST